LALAKFVMGHPGLEKLWVGQNYLQNKDDNRNGYNQIFERVKDSLTPNVPYGVFLKIFRAIRDEPFINGFELLVGAISLSPNLKNVTLCDNGFSHRSMDQCGALFKKYFKNKVFEFIDIQSRCMEKNNLFVEKIQMCSSIGLKRMCTELNYPMLQVFHGRNIFSSFFPQKTISFFQHLFLLPNLREVVSTQNECMYWKLLLKVSKWIRHKPSMRVFRIEYMDRYSKCDPTEIIECIDTGKSDMNDPVAVKRIQSVKKSMAKTLFSAYWMEEFQAPMVFDTKTTQKSKKTKKIKNNYIAEPEATLITRVSVLNQNRKYLGLRKKQIYNQTIMSMKWDPFDEEKQFWKRVDERAMFLALTEHRKFVFQS